MSYQDSYWLMRKLRLRACHRAVGELRCELDACDSRIWVLSHEVMTLSPWDLLCVPTCDINDLSIVLNPCSSREMQRAIPDLDMAK